MSARHTPGPWEVERSGTQVVAVDGEDGCEFTVADCVRSADARLVAESPAMLDILRLISSAVSKTSEPYRLGERLVERINAVVARSSGESC